MGRAIQAGHEDLVQIAVACPTLEPLPAVEVKRLDRPVLVQFFAASASAHRVRRIRARQPQAPSTANPLSLPRHRACYSVSLRTPKRIQVWRPKPKTPPRGR